MAITSAGVGTKATTTTTQITLNAPGSPASDDIWIAAMFSADDDAHTFTDWTELFNSPGTGTSVRLSVWYFRYAGSTPNLIATIDAGGDECVGGIASFRGCKTSGSPVNTMSAFNEGVDTSIEHTAISPSVENCALLAINGSENNNTRTALGGDYVSAFDDGGGANAFLFDSGEDLSLALSYDLAVAAGSTGTVTQTQSASDNWISVLIALEPADGAAPTGWPSQYNDGGVRFSDNNAHQSQGNNLWRRALSGLFLPPKPRFVNG